MKIVTTKPLYLIKIIDKVSLGIEPNYENYICRKKILDRIATEGYPSKIPPSNANQFVQF
jgi:hypothetical protein